MSLIRQSVETLGLDLDGVEGHCVGSKFHSPTPLRVHPTALGTETVLLCSTCRDNVNVYLGLMRATEGDLPWTVRREFGNRVRALGEMALGLTEESQSA